MIVVIVVLRPPCQLFDSLAPKMSYLLTHSRALRPWAQRSGTLLMRQYIFARAARGVGSEVQDPARRAQRVVPVLARRVGGARPNFRTRLLHTGTLRGYFLLRGGGLLRAPVACSKNLTDPGCQIPDSYPGSRPYPLTLLVRLLYVAGRREGR